MKKYFLYLYLFFCGIFFSCANDLIDTSQSNGPVNWQMFDTALYTSDILAGDGNLLFYAGEFGSCYKIQNGVKSYYDFQYQNFNPNRARYYNENIFAFGNVNLQPYYYHYYSYYDTSKIKLIEGSSIKTLTFHGYHDSGDLFDFIFLDSDKLLISSTDSIYIQSGLETKKIKGTYGGGYTYLHRENNLTYMIRFFQYERNSSVSKIVNDSAVMFIPSSPADKLWFNFIKDKVVKEVHTADKKISLSYLSSNGWIDFFRTDAKYLQSIAGDDINNFYFSIRDTSGKSVKKYYNGSTFREDNFFGQDSICMGRNPVNGEIYSWKTNRATGVSYIYRGRIR